MTKYTAINIGPVVATLDLVRKPRDLWAASYLFSFLMKHIVDEINKTNGIKVLSPDFSEIKENEYTGVGLYPDRVYCTGEWTFEEKREVILDKFVNSLKPDADDTLNWDALKQYFNIMCVSSDFSDNVSETQAIAQLNQWLDYLELNNKAISEEAQEAVWEYITLSKHCKKLYERAFLNKKFGHDGYVTLAEYASIQLSAQMDLRKGAHADVERTKQDDVFEIKEDAFYHKLKTLFEKKIKSYHKYICLVQADGDRMGTIFTHPKLKNGDTAAISQLLVSFGQHAAEKIYEYGGLPIYAGGDDLLFLAPVVGKQNTNIFNLLDQINDCFKPIIKKVGECKTEEGGPLEDGGKPIVPSMSYGVSITYYKFPLYEALSSARLLLLDHAKHNPKKNVISLDWRKHSGGAFRLEISGFDDKLKQALMDMIMKSTVDESVVSAISYKIRENIEILKLWQNRHDFRQRNKNFFINYLEYNPQKEAGEKTESDKYKEAALKLLDELFALQGNDVYAVTKTMYSMLRIAKFINGEDAKND